MFQKLILILFFLITLNSCSKPDKDLVYQPIDKENPYELYKDGLDAFEKNDFFLANKKFSEAELNFAISELAAKSAIMSIFFVWNEFL